MAAKSSYDAALAANRNTLKTLGADVDRKQKIYQSAARVLSDTRTKYQLAQGNHLTKQVQCDVAHTHYDEMK